MLALACLAGIVLVGWGAVSGPLSVATGTDRSSTTVQAPATYAPSVPARPRTHQDKPNQRHRSRDMPWLRYLVRVLAGIVALGALALLGYLARGLPHRLALRWRHRSFGQQHEAALGPAPAVPIGEVADALAQDRLQQLSAVDRGSPRNGIVAAWYRLEQIAERCGLPPHDWETSVEFTTRMLGELDVDETAVISLADLYRMARFSSHPVAEVDRDRARAALTRLHDELRSLAS